MGHMDPQQALMPTHAGPHVPLPEAGGRPRHLGSGAVPSQGGHRQALRTQALSPGFPPTPKSSQEQPISLPFRLPAPMSGIQEQSPFHFTS